MRRAKLAIPAISLDRASQVPVHRQIYEALFRSIRDGSTVRGARLPSSRVLAKMLGVSRNTVLKAYDELAADGLIEGQRGSATTVCRDQGGVEPSLFRLRQIIQDSGFPERILQVEDADGNPLYVRF